MGELVIACAWLMTPSPFWLIPAAAGAALFLVFLIVVVRAHARKSDAECMCFGMRRAVGPATIVRNAVLLASASAALIGILVQTTPASANLNILTLVFELSIPEILAGALLLGGMIALLVAAESGGTSDPQVAPDVDQHQSHALGGGVPAPVASPRVAFLDATGRYATIDEVASPHGVLLLVLSETCYLCDLVRERLEHYRASLAPVRVAVVGAIEQYGALPPDVDLGDLAMMASERLGATTYPAGLIALPNGTIPVGPVLGPDAIDALVEELASDLKVARGEAHDLNADGFTPHSSQ
ncbi:MAG: hypothetical protein BGN97_11250 [Microbacterium sp. 69-10]|nr:MAG: hypothetical protein BGN97_11250 [Microbacterium sp. 69-10]